MAIKTNLALIVMASMALYSCKQDLQPQDSPIDESAAITEATQDPNGGNIQMQGGEQANAQPQIMDSPQMQPAQQPVSKVAAGMNPAHGQPGHRCDIQVGAPLNSPAGKPAPQPITTPVQQSMPAAPSILNAPSGNTAVGMNPAHGQPGHKCDVAVGAPL
ncbi:hypothetical protein [Flavobacterium ardleyense]|uniref:hypothetical protein n=1 Tax=Flavobacterium ardleyense TaxID=2038737 RepID=UPI00298C429B|nr:hypothetical protein [Flavobacterium ardleyense]